VTDVLVVGEALVDVVEDTEGGRTERPGGSPANVAVGLARLGHRVQLLTALGDDQHGRDVRAHLEGSGVEVVAARLPRTSTALARLDTHGSATYDFDITWDLSGTTAGTAEWVHVGSLAAVMQPGADTVLALAQQAAQVSFDPNCRPDIVPRDLERIEQLADLSTIVKLSDEDLAWLYPSKPFAEVARQWLTGRADLVALTKGADGAEAFTARGLLEVPPAAGSAVVDTVGAGDAFMAGLLDGRFRGLPDADALAHAATVARRTCERTGADPPWAREL
jgi:fructokinase